MNPIPDEMIESFAREVLRLRSEYEFGTFWLGTRVAGPVTPEEALAIKAEINRRVGQCVERTGAGDWWPRWSARWSASSWTTRPAARACSACSRC